MGRPRVQWDNAYRIKSLPLQWCFKRGPYDSGGEGAGGFWKGSGLGLSWTLLDATPEIVQNYEWFQAHLDAYLLSRPFTYASIIEGAEIKTVARPHTHTHTHAQIQTATGNKTVIVNSSERIWTHARPTQTKLDKANPSEDALWQARRRQRTQTPNTCFIKK